MQFRNGYSSLPTLGNTKSLYAGRTTKWLSSLIFWISSRPLTKKERRWALIREEAQIDSRRNYKAGDGPENYTIQD